MLSSFCSSSSSSQSTASPKKSKCLLVYVTLATQAFFANCFDIYYAIVKGVVSYVLPSRTLPSGNVIWIDFFSKLDIFSYYSSQNF